MKSKTSSRSTKSRNEIRKNVKRPNQKTTQLKQKELDSTCHRLSRPADKFASAKASKSSDSEFYSVTYFKKYPQLKDESKPEDKLKKLDEQLQDENLSSEERFTALVKKKAVSTIFYGQESPEVVKATAELGSFYKKEGKPSSAIRHYEKAREIKRSVQIPENESMMIDIETAESYLSVQAQKDSALTENTNKASKIINPYADTEIEDPKIAYRRDAILGRIAVRREKMADAEKHYIDAKNHLDEANKGEKNVETGVIDFELAKVFTAENKHQTAGQLYQSAYDTFVDLEMNDEAEIVKPFLPTGSEVDEENEADEYKDEENTETNTEKNTETNSETNTEANTETNILIETRNAIERNLLNLNDSKDETMENEDVNDSKITKSESNKQSSSGSSSSDEETKKDIPKATDTIKEEEQNDKITDNSSDDEDHKDKITKSSSDNEETKKIEPESTPQNETLPSDNEDNFDNDSDEKNKESINLDSNKQDSASSDGGKKDTSDEEKKVDSDFDDFEDSSKNGSDKEEKSTEYEAKDSTQNDNSESDNKDSDIISDGNFDDDFNDDY